MILMPPVVTPMELSSAIVTPDLKVTVFPVPMLTSVPEVPTIVAKTRHAPTQLAVSSVPVTMVTPAMVSLVLTSTNAIVITNAPCLDSATTSPVVTTVLVNLVLPVTVLIVSTLTSVSRVFINVI